MRLPQFKAPPFLATQDVSGWYILTATSPDLASPLHSPHHFELCVGPSAQQVDGSQNPANHQGWWLSHSLFMRVLTFPGGCLGFLPSTVFLIIRFIQVVCLLTNTWCKIHLQTTWKATALTPCENDHASAKQRGWTKFSWENMTCNTLNRGL